MAWGLIEMIARLAHAAGPSVVRGQRVSPVADHMDWPLGCAFGLSYPAVPSVGSLGSVFGLDQLDQLTSVIGCTMGLTQWADLNFALTEKTTLSFRRVLGERGKVRDE